MSDTEVAEEDALEASESVEDGEECAGLSGDECACAPGDAAAFTMSRSSRSPVGMQEDVIANAPSTTTTTAQTENLLQLFSSGRSINSTAAATTTAPQEPNEFLNP